MRQADRQIKKSMDKLLKAARAMPDQIVTQDRMAVAQAVRGASSRAPERPAIKYGDLTDAEFAKEKAKYGL